MAAAPVCESGYGGAVGEVEGVGESGLVCEGIIAGDAWAGCDSGWGS